MLLTLSDTYSYDALVVKDIVLVISLMVIVWLGVNPSL